MPCSTVLTTFLKIFSHILVLSGNPGSTSECPDPAAEDGGGQQCQARSDWCPEGHQGPIWDHCFEKHAGIWGLVQVQGGQTYTLTVITHKHTNTYSFLRAFLSFFPTVCWFDWVCKAQHRFSAAGQAGGQRVQEADSVSHLWNRCAEKHGKVKHHLSFFYMNL